jgi:hypothetical protein
LPGTLHQTKAEADAAEHLDSARERVG